MNIKVRLRRVPIEYSCSLQERPSQERIQDFARVCVGLGGGRDGNFRRGVPTYFFVNFVPKTAWKRKNLDQKGKGGASLAPLLDPPLPVYFVN